MLRERPMPRLPPAVILGVKKVNPTRTTIAAHSPCFCIAFGTADREYSVSFFTFFKSFADIFLLLSNQQPYDTGVFIIHYIY